MSASPPASEPSPAGMIFDLDDTLAWTTPLWQAAERRLLASIGATWTAELARKYKGMNVYDLAAVVHRELRPAEALPALQERMRGLLIEAVTAGQVEPTPGGVELVRRVRAMGRPLAVASGSPPPVIAMVLDRLGIADAFDLVLSSEAVKRGKPHPDVFLAAAERLGVPAEGCLVFEDSLVGATAAAAARMRCFVVPSLADERIATVATRVFASWDAVQAGDVEAAVNGAASR